MDHVRGIISSLIFFLFFFQRCRNFVMTGEIKANWQLLFTHLFCLVSVALLSYTRSVRIHLLCVWNKILNISWNKNVSHNKTLRKLINLRDRRTHRDSLHYSKMLLTVSVWRHAYYADALQLICLILCWLLKYYYYGLVIWCTSWLIWMVHTMNARSCAPLLLRC